MSDRDDDAVTDAVAEHAARAPATGEWQALIERGRYDLAADAYRFTDGSDGLLRSNLETLSDAIAAVRDKRWRTAAAAIERLEQRHEALPWEAIDADLDALAEANAALDRREEEDARAHLSRAAGTGFPAEAATLMGTLAVFEGDQQRARERFEAALELDPNHFRALTNLGNLLLEEGDVDGAIAAYQRAIRLNDSFANAHHNLGVAYRRKGQVAQSVRSLRRAQRESNRRDVAQARDRLARSSPRAAGGARSTRWLLILLAAGFAYWLLVLRTP